MANSDLIEKRVRKRKDRQTISEGLGDADGHILPHGFISTPIKKDY
jgi:hypothetical protein